MRQGDPLSPFLFLITVEGHMAHVQKAVNIGAFSGFKVGNDLQIQILQYVDDTIIMGGIVWRIYGVSKPFGEASNSYQA